VSQFYIDVADLADTSDFSQRYGSAELDLVDDSGDALRVGTGGTTLSLWSYDPAGQDQEIDIIAFLRSTGTDGNQRGGLGARGTTGGNCYASHCLGVDDLNVTEYTAGARGSKGTDYSSATCDVYHWKRFQCFTNGATSDLKAKSWTGAIGDEPGAWEIEVSDASQQNSGYACLASWNNNSSIHYYKILAIGTGGDLAPVAPVGGAVIIMPPVRRILHNLVR
jgi:hypothetical protein